MQRLSCMQAKQVQEMLRWTGAKALSINRSWVCDTCHYYAKQVQELLSCTQTVESWGLRQQ